MLIIAFVIFLLLLQQIIIFKSGIIQFLLSAVPEIKRSNVTRQVSLAHWCKSIMRHHGMQSFVSIAPRYFVRRWMTRQSWSYCHKSCCRLSSSSFIPATVLYRNKLTLLMHHFNLNAHNVIFFAKKRLKVTKSNNNNPGGMFYKRWSKAGPLNITNFLKGKWVKTFHKCL